MLAVLDDDQVLGWMRLRLPHPRPYNYFMEKPASSLSLLEVDACVVDKRSRIISAASLPLRE